MLAGPLKLRVRVGPVGGMAYVARRLGSDRVMIDDGAHTQFCWPVNLQLFISAKERSGSRRYTLTKRTTIGTQLWDHGPGLS